jgi:hypothetical protein
MLVRSALAVISDFLLQVVQKIRHKKNRRGGRRLGEFGTLFYCLRSELSHAGGDREPKVAKEKALQIHDDECNTAGLTQT